MTSHSRSAGISEFWAENPKILPFFSMEKQDQGLQGFPNLGNSASPDLGHASYGAGSSIPDVFMEFGIHSSRMNGSHNIPAIFQREKKALGKRIPHFLGGKNETPNPSNKKKKSRNKKIRNFLAPPVRNSILGGSFAYSSPRLIF